MSADDIAALLKELSSYHRKSTDRFTSNYYQLSIARDEHTSVTLDTPPKTFSPLLAIRANNISLLIDNRQSSRKIELRLTHGDASIYSNKIEIYAHDEDWVNLTWQKLNDRIAAIEAQPSLDTRYHKIAFLIISMLLGWLMLSAFLNVIKWIFLPGSVTPSTSTSSSAFVYFNMACLIFSFGIWPTGWLFSYAKAAYPSVELQAGPIKDRVEPHRRIKLKWLCGIFIGGPFANFVYDVYKYILNS